MSDVDEANLQEATDKLLLAITTRNPFQGNRVNHYEEVDAQVDADVIHHAEFLRLTQAGETVFTEQRSIGVTILGAPGVGKSHLLARLSRWANERQACFVWLHNIQASAERQARYLLRCVVHVLASGRRSPWHGSLLYEVINNALVTVLKADNRYKRNLQWKEVLAAFQRRVLRGVPDPQPYNLLLNYYRFVNTLEHPKSNLDKSNIESTETLIEAALDWLSGDPISPDHAARLGLRVDGSGSVSLGDDQDVEHALLALTHMASLAARPMVFCLDQVDNIGPEPLRSLSRFLHALLDHARGLLVVVSGVREALLEYAKNTTISQAAWARLAQNMFELKRISPDAARAIINVRLEHFFKPYAHLPALLSVKQRDPLFPLGASWFANLLGGVPEISPRQVITVARAEWERIQQQALAGDRQWLTDWNTIAINSLTPTTHVNETNTRMLQPSHPRPENTIPAQSKPIASPDEVLADLLRMKCAEMAALRRRQRDSLPPDADNIACLTETLLLATVATPSRRVSRLPEASTSSSCAWMEILTGGTADISHTLILILIANDGRSATPALRRLLGKAADTTRLVLVTDEERRPLPLANAGRSYFEQLSQCPHFVHHHFNFQQHVELDAMVAVMGMARVGDLEIHHPVPRAITEAEVKDYWIRHQVLIEFPLMRVLLSAPQSAESVLSQAN